MKINVPEKYADLYLKALAERKQALEQKINAFKDEIAEIDNHIRNLTSIPIFNETDELHTQVLNFDGYSPEWSWTRKISFFQQQVNHIFTAGDIVEFILESEPDLDKSKSRSSISAALSNWVRQKRYSKFIDPLSNTTYYGPSDWFLSNGNPQIDYIPDTLKNKLLKRT
ncbi:MAG: hypothetical protein AAF149_06350 [Bacteroidota bacterium]